MSIVAAADPASKVSRIFTDPASLTQAIEQYKFIPLRQDGTPFIVNFLTNEGGYLLDGAPMNVWFDGVWYEGQKEVGQKYWGQNGVPTPSQQILALPVVPMPMAIAETYQAFKTAQGGIFSGNNLLYIGLGVIVLLWLSSGKSAGGAAAWDDYD